LPYKDPEKQKEWHIQRCKKLSEEQKYVLSVKSNEYHNKRKNDPEYNEKLKIRYKKSYQKHRKKRLKLQKEYNKTHPEQRLNSIKLYLKKLGKNFDMTINEYMYAHNSWSKSIKVRDKVCQICNSKKHLNSHHIFYKNSYPQLSLNINNGIVLCVSCHGELHGYTIYQNK